ncbi:hypothetical protein [Vibrio brasiliensis]
MVKFLSERNKKNLSVDIHPRAYEAYQFFHAQMFLFHKTELGTHVLHGLQKGQFFSVVQNSGSKCYLFSGFEIHGFSIGEFDMSTHKVVVYDDLDDDEIEILAWSGVFRVLLSSVQGGSMEALRKSINKQVPKSVLSSIFSVKTLTQEFIAKCTPYSLAGLKKQNKKSVVTAPDTRTISIFEQLTSEIRDDES